MKTCHGQSDHQLKKALATQESILEQHYLKLDVHWWKRHAHICNHSYREIYNVIYDYIDTYIHIQACIYFMQRTVINLQVNLGLQVHASALPLWIQSCNPPNQSPISRPHSSHHFQNRTRRRRHLARRQGSTPHRIRNRRQRTHTSPHQTVHIFGSRLRSIILHMPHS
jgi:hypothetical protein